VLRDLTRSAFESLRVPGWLLRGRQLVKPLLLLSCEREHALKALCGLLRSRRRLHLGSGLGDQLTLQVGIQICVECVLHSSLDTAALASIPRLILDHVPPPDCTDPEKAVQR
jgi:hypothetical protein